LAARESTADEGVVLGIHQGARMVTPKIIEVDYESLRILRSLVNSAQVCLDGLEARLQKELEVIGVVRALTEKASRSLAEIVEPQGEA
jgi:hypothetical protein